jgi:integrase
MKLQRLEIPPRLSYTLFPQSAMPPAIIADWARARDCFLVSDPYSPDRRRKPLKISTIENMWQRLRLGYDAAIRAGVPMEELRTFGDLINLDVVAIIGEQLKVDPESSPRRYRTTFEVLIKVAREIVGVDRAHIEEMLRMKRLVPKCSIGMTQRNRRTVDQFNDQEATRRLLRCSDELFEAAFSTGANWWTFGAFQTAISIRIFIQFGIRISDLRQLSYEKHILDTDGPCRLLQILRPEKGTHTSLEFSIPESLAEKLSTFRHCIAPRWLGYTPTFLWDGGRGKPKSPAIIRDQVERYIRYYVGVDMNPHAFRHLIAKWFLDADPGDFESVRRVLGHEDVYVTAKYYAGEEAARGVKLLGQKMASYRGRKFRRSARGK